MGRRQVVPRYAVPLAHLYEISPDVWGNLRQMALAYLAYRAYHWHILSFNGPSWPEAHPNRCICPRAALLSARTHQMLRPIPVETPRWLPLNHYNTPDALLNQHVYPQTPPLSARITPDAKANVQLCAR